MSENQVLSVHPVTLDDKLGLNVALIILNAMIGNDIGDDAFGEPRRIVANRPARGDAINTGLQASAIVLGQGKIVFPAEFLRDSQSSLRPFCWR